MTLGFSVAALAPFKGGRAGLRMGLVPLAEAKWRQPTCDPPARREALAHDGSVLTLPEGEAAAKELAALLGTVGGMREAGTAGHEDWCLLVERDGAHVLVGGAIGWPTDWRLADKLGLPLLAVHAPFHGYAARLAAGVEQFLRGLRVAQFFGRANWFVVESDAPRYLPDDDPRERFAHVTAANAGRTLFVRCERQTFRRLPETGAISFGIGVYVARLDELSADLVRDLAQAVTVLPDGEGERRAAPRYSAALCGYAAARQRGEAT